MSNSVSIKEVIALTATKANTTQKEARIVYDALVEAVKELLVKADTDKLALPGFVTFKKSSVEERQGRNPATGGAITIPAYTRLGAKPASSLKDAVR